MHHIFMKIYGAFHPAPETVDEALAELQGQVIGDADWLDRHNDMLRISYEGIWFPVEEALQILAETLPPKASGKLDVLDLDAWTLTRHLWQDGEFHASPSRDLNSVMDYSGL